MFRGFLIVSCLLLLVIGCNIDKSICGKWQYEDVIYTLYPDHTGAVDDSIEGDSIKKWWIEADTLVYVIDGPYQDTIKIQATREKDNLLIENEFKFRKISGI